MNKFFEDALSFLDKKEPEWGFSLNRWNYLEDLISHLADRDLAKSLADELYGSFIQEYKFHIAGWARVFWEEAGRPDGNEGELWCKAQAHVRRCYQEFDTPFGGCGCV